MMPPWALHMFLQLLGQMSEWMRIFWPMHEVEPIQVFLQPPLQHTGKVVPHTTPPNCIQQS
jgi:hypothetical protein